MAQNAWWPIYPLATLAVYIPTNLPLKHVNIKRYSEVAVFRHIPEFLLYTF